MEELIVKLLINGVGIANDVHPVFGDDIKINLDREENQIFRREKIEGTFQFLGQTLNSYMGVPSILHLPCRYIVVMPLWEVPILSVPIVSSILMMASVR